jgi:hypothetical protein
MHRLTLPIFLGMAIAGCANDPATEDETALELSTPNAREQVHKSALAQCPSNTPDALAPPADERLKIGLSATGVQIYTCSKTDSGFAWTFKAPEAKLFFGRFKVGTHFGGPTWRLFDGSQVVTSKVGSVNVDPTAVPWLLTKTVSTAGKGFFSDITSVQRLSTTGGLAPTDGCTADADVGKDARVPYTADYFFYAKASSPSNSGCR